MLSFILIMRRCCIIFFALLFSFPPLFCQSGKTRESSLFFNGIVRDASTYMPLRDAQIFLNRSFIAVTGEDGTFALRVNRRDTVDFRLLGYNDASFHVSDTLPGLEFMVGIYMMTDTIAIEEVVIVPRLKNLKYDIYKPPAVTPEMQNAKYNVAVSAYQGRMSMGKLGDPESNYAVIHQRNLRNAAEKGTIPSNAMVGLSPIMLIGAAYLLINGLPPKPEPMKSDLSREELDQIHKSYLERLREE